MGIARSGIGWLLAKYGTLALSFAALMYFTRALPDPTATLGLFQVFEAGVAFVMLLTSAGLGTAVVKRISEGDDQPELVGAVGIISFVLLVPITLGAILASGRIASYFGAGFVVVALVLVTLWAKQIANMASSILVGTSRVGRSGGIEFVEMLTRVIAQVALVVLGFELVGLVAGAAIGTVAAATTAIYLLPFGASRPKRNQFESLLSFTKYSFFQGVAGRVYNHVDTLVIAALLSNSAVSLYNVPYRITLVLNVFSGSIHTSILPAISDHDSDADYERIGELLEDAIVFSTILAIPATVGMALLARPIVITFFTSAFAAGSTVAVLAMAIQIPEGLRSVFTSATMGLDRPDLTLRSSVVLVVVNIFLDVILVPTVGIEGAAIATLTGSTIATAYLGWHLFELLDLNRTFVPFGPLAAQVGAATAMGALVYVLRDLLHLPAVPKLVALVGVGALAYWAVLLAISPSTRRRVGGIAADVLPA